jgi:hypothetical protein
MKDDVTLLDKINKAVAEVNAAQAEVASKYKAVGLLLLEAKKIHKGKAFEAFLKRVDGLGLSRAYDCMRLAGGRVTEEELRRDARERQQRSREKKKKKIPKPAPTPLPDFRDVTESLPKPEPKQPVSAISDAMHRVTGAGKSAFALREFTFACKSWLPQITKPDDQVEAIRVMGEWTQVMAANKGRAA